jgi:hypothetical protein
MKEWKIKLTLGLASVLLVGQHASAQEQPKGQQAQQPQGQGNQAPEPRQPEAVEKTLDEANVKPRDYSKPNQEPPPPEAPGSIKQVQSGQPMEVAVKAGEGSPIAYGRASVVELGGSLAFTHQSETTIFTFTPTFGYFVADGFELSVLPELRITDVEGEDGGENAADVSIGGAVEPSFHLAFNPSVYGFLALGLGVRYAEDPGFDLFFRPSIGMDILIGRSGILKPALFMDVGVNEGTTAGGFQAGFTVML